MTKTHEVSTNKLIVIVLSSILSTMVVTAFSLLRVANSDHFAVIAIDQRLGTLEDVAVSRVEYAERAKHIDASLERIETKVDRLLEEY